MNLPGNVPSPEGSFAQSGERRSRKPRFFLSAFRSSLLLEALRGAGSSFPSALRTWLDKAAFFCLGVSVLVIPFSPDLSLSSLGSTPGRIRLDDIALLLAGLASIPRLPRLLERRSAIDFLWLCYLLWGIVSTIHGLLTGTVIDPSEALFSTLKRFEYAAFYFLLILGGGTRERRRALLALFFTSVTAVALYGYLENRFRYPYLSHGWDFYYRLYERGFFSDQATHLAGFLGIGLCLGISHVLFTNGWKARAIYAGWSLLLLPPLVWTYSRQVWLAVGLGLLGISFLKGRRVFLIALGALLFLVIFSPHSAKERMRELVSENVFSPDSRSSAQDRIRLWQRILNDFPRFPILGVGWGARPRVMYESQYVMELSEAGLVGFSLFLLLLAAVLRSIRKKFATGMDADEGVIGAAAFGALLALLFQSFFSIGFLISRTAYPLWFLAALCESPRPENAAESTGVRG